MVDPLLGSALVQRRPPWNGELGRIDAEAPPIQDIHLLRARGEATAGERRQFAGAKRRQLRVTADGVELETERAQQRLDLRLMPDMRAELLEQDLEMWRPRHDPLHAAQDGRFVRGLARLELTDGHRDRAKELIAPFVAALLIAVPPDVQVPAAAAVPPRADQ